MSKSPVVRLSRALCSLEGLSVGDAFGQAFFILDPEIPIAERRLPASPWRFTDDTQMALSIVTGLHEFGEISQDELAKSFSEHYDNTRGYGAAMHNLLSIISLPGAWRVQSKKLFGGAGSFGNGAAMRAAPIGAYFAHDLHRVVEQAHLASEITHTHPEASAGAIAVAVAAAFAWRLRQTAAPTRSDFIDLILPSVPKGRVFDRLVIARDLDPNTSVQDAVAMLGNGEAVAAYDTVPFALWCAGEALSHFENALWLTVSGLGDRDTTCAMVGGIVSVYTAWEGIPHAWREAREPLPTW